MCDSRVMFIKQMDLETIEEEDADFLSQHSRNNLKNGVNKRAVQSQTNTITTYDTQQTDFLDVNSLGYLNGAGGGSAQNSWCKPGPGGRIIAGIGGTRANSLKSTDKWDRNYYYNDYDTVGHQYNYPKPFQSARSREGTNSGMASRLSSILCWSSVRFLILFLSFLVLASLFANLQLFNIVALYAEKDLLPSYLQQGAGASKSNFHPGAVHWGTSPSANETEQQKKEDMLARERLGEVMGGNEPTENWEEKDGRKDSEGVKKKENGRKNGTESEEQRLMGKQKREASSLNETGPTASALPLNLPRGNLLDRLLQSTLFSVPGLAILIGHFPSVFLIHRFGAHKVIFGALLLSGAVTAAFPFIIASVSIYYIVLARFLLGLSFSPAFALIGLNANRWATVGEQLFFILIGLLALQFGPALSWVGAINLLNMDHISRIRLFGLHSAVTTLLAIIWLLFYRDMPQKYSLVNGEELHHIFKKKPVRNRRPRLPHSVRSLLLRSTSAWACWSASFCYFFALLSMLIFLPVFVFKVLRHSVQISIVTPFLLLSFTHLFVHFLGKCVFDGDYSTWKVRTFNSAAFLLSALAFLGITIIPRDHNYEFRCVLLLWLCLFPLGLCSLGFLKSADICGGYFARHIVANMQIAFGLAYFLVPTLVFSVDSESPIIHWRLLFLVTALILLLGLAIFVILGRGTPTSWAESVAEEARAEESLLMVKFTKRPVD